MKDLTVSAIDRQNILNNQDAVINIQSFIGVSGLLFENQFRFTKEHVAEFYKVDTSTIDLYLSRYEKELRQNGYELFKGPTLKKFKEEFSNIISIQTKTTQLGVFNFKAFLNLGMLLVESEMARAMRSKILDIVIDTLNLRLGGSAKYINQRDEDFFHSILKEPHYRKEFTSALHNYLDMGNYKYEYYTDEIYKAIFIENAKEYKQILKLEDQENPRETMYAEVLVIVSSFEAGLAHEMQEKYQILNRKLSKTEMDELLRQFANHPLHKPHVESARTKMASRDYGFRSVLHDNLKNYLSTVDLNDYQRFLGEKSKTLQERIDENIEVFKRLKDK